MRSKESIELITIKRRLKVVNKLNELIKQLGGNVFIDRWDIECIHFTNGVSLYYKDDHIKIRQLLTRLRSKNLKSVQRWVLCLDDLLHNYDDVTFKIRQQIRSENGLKTQSLYGDKIKKNNLTAQGWNKGLKGSDNPNYGKHPHSPEFLKWLSESRKGAGNPMYGTRYSDEYKKAKSEFMKGRILRGEFTPNTNNRLTHYDIEYRGKRYRSSWEVLFAHTHPDYEYEKLRIPYILNGKSHVYIVDFVNHTTKTAVEIKPSELMNKQNNDVKINALKKWAAQNGYSVQLLMQNEITELAKNTDLSVFSEDVQNKLNTLINNETSYKARNSKI